MSTPSPSTSGVPRVFAVIRALAAVQAEGGRVTEIARAVGLTQATTHRLLQSLLAEGMVEQDARSKLYRLGIDFFALAAHAGNPGDLRSLCRPVLLRLCASLGDSIFLLARSGFDAVCLDRSEGLFRSALSPATSAGASRWAWARVRSRSWPSCQRPSAKR